MIPPKPEPRPDHVSLWRYLRLFRRDILSAQPARLYRALMAEFRTPFFRSFLCSDPEIVAEVLKRRPEDFPKSARLREGLAPLLGRSVFLTNGAEWRRQRRIIDPAFEGGRIRDVLPAMCDAAEAAVARLRAQAGRTVEIEAEASHVAADVIFRTLFSIPIDDDLAGEVFGQFRAHQSAQPILNLGALLPLPRWVPRLHSRRARRTARRIRLLIRQLTEARAREILHGRAPDDLATRIMTTPDPEDGQTFTTAEMVDQVAIFFLAGHETSAAALAWSLYLLAADPDAQARAAAEARAVLGQGRPALGDVSRLVFIRDVFREALRLYPPVPMMVREARCPVRFRGRAVPAGSQIVISPWHLHRHVRFWPEPDAFDPDRWRRDGGTADDPMAYIPFSAGPRVCTGAAFAMVEGPLILAMVLRDLAISPAGEIPAPVAFLTVRSRKGIFLTVTERNVN